LEELEEFFFDGTAFEKLAKGARDDVVSKVWLRTKRIYEDSFLATHHTNFDTEMVGFQSRREVVSQAYRSLIEELEDDKVECETLKNSESFFEHVVRRIETYEKLHGRTLQVFGAASEINEAETLTLRAAVSAQKSRADIIHEEAKAMLTVLLELVGQRPH